MLPNEFNCSKNKPLPPILILGLGNSLIADDAVGHFVIARLLELLPDSPYIECVAIEESGLSLLDWIIDRKLLIIIDAMLTGKNPPGHWEEFSIENLHHRSPLAPHFLGLSDIIDLAKIIGLNLPPQIIIIGIEVADIFTVGGNLTQPVLNAIEPVTRRIVEIIDKWLEG